MEIFLYFVTKSKKITDLNVYRGKLSDFVSFYFFLLTSATKLRDAHFVDHWSSLIFCDLRTIISDLNMPWGKMSKSVSFLLFALTFVIKLKDLEFKIHSNTSLFLTEKNDGRFEYVPWKNIWLWFSYLVLRSHLSLK